MPRIAVIASLWASLMGCADAALPPVNGSLNDVVVTSASRDALPIRAPPTCGGSRTALIQQRAEVMLIVDRSGSMNEDDSDGRRKWSSLVAVLDGLLPEVEDHVALGLLLFPAGVEAGGAEAACTTVPAVSPVPSFSNARAVLAALAAVTPAGGTPTWAALTAAARYFEHAPDPLGRRYVVLATDGAPNCNPDLDPRTCVCAAPAFACLPSHPSYRTNCLDDVRTLAAIRALAAHDVGTFVVGLLGVESMADVLDAMAIAGGHPRDDERRFYAGASRAELASALRGITSSVIDCRFRLDAPPPDPDLVDVRLGDERLPRDRTLHDGWEWSDTQHQEVAFYGATCERVRGESGGVILSAVFGCPAATPP